MQLSKFPFIFQFLFHYYHFLFGLELIGIPQLGKLGNNILGNSNSTDGAKVANINGNTSVATIAAMANAMVAAAQANAGLVAMQHQNQTPVPLSNVSSSNTMSSSLTVTSPLGEPDPNDPNASSQKKTCPYCCQQLSWHALSRHIRDMHRARTGLVTCKYCHKMFRNKNSLGCHMWRFHKDMREKDQGGNVNPSSGGKTESMLESENQSSNTDVVDSYSLQVDPRSSQSASISGENISKASSPASKSEAWIDPPDYDSNSPLELSAAKTKNLEQEKALI